jgi:hypothetical protein
VRQWSACASRLACGFEQQEIEAERCDEKRGMTIEASEAGTHGVYLSFKSSPGKTYVCNLNWIKLQ